MKQLFNLLLIGILLATASCDFLEMEDEPEKAVISLFEMDKSNCVAPCEVSFTNLSFEFICEWNFDDGSEITEDCSPTHIFQDPGTYEVSLTVENENGTSHTSSQTLTVNDGSNIHPFSGLKTLTFFYHTSAVKAVEVNDGFVVLANIYPGSPLSTKAFGSVLAKFNYLGQLESAEDVSDMIANDIIQTLDGRILLCGSTNNVGSVIEIDHDLMITKEYLSTRVGSVFNSIDHNNLNDIYIAGHQDIDGINASLVVKIASSFSERAEFHSYDPSSSNSLNHVQAHDDKVYFSNYSQTNAASQLFRMDQELYDIEELAFVDDQVVKSVKVDDAEIIVSTIGTSNAESFLYTFDHDLNEESTEILISSEYGQVYPSHLTSGENEIIISSFVFTGDADCPIHSVLQKRSNIQTTNNETVYQCDNHQGLYINSINQLNNEEYLAMGFAIKDDTYQLALTMLDASFTPK